MAKERILVVEDEEDILELVSFNLDREGYQVVRAKSGEQALKTVETYDKEIHLMITDVIMPGINGHKLADRLNEKRPGIKVLFMSGYSASNMPYHVNLDDDIFFIEKPISPTTLAKKIQEVLAAGPSAP